MKPILVTGTVIVQLALASYTIAIILEQRIKRVAPVVLIWLSCGVFFDILATACMITGSSNPWYSPHGFVGYSSLAGMTAETGWMWVTRLRKGVNSPVSPWLHRYSRLAYIWWVLAYITGALLVIAF